MIINNNTVSKNAYRNVADVNARLSKSIEKLSSGEKINRAGDDAAGLAISEKMRAQIKGLDAATKNAQNGISLIQTAEGALFETHAILQRMRELSIQAANDTNTASDRVKIQLELDALREELDKIAESTEFNTRVLFTGEYEKDKDGLVFHVGANKDQNVVVTLKSMDAEELGVAGGSQNEALSVKTQKDANNAISKFENAIETVSQERARYGALQNRLEHGINNLRVASENLTAARSRITDTDIAKEIVEFSKDRIISQSGTSMLAQANAMPQDVLKLID
jgi:flagellin